jgi:hypothetical protein
MTPMLTTQGEETSTGKDDKKIRERSRDERMQKVKGRRGLDVANLGNEVVELLLGEVVLLGPLIAGGLQGLHLALVVAGLDVGLAEPV